MIEVKSSYQVTFCCAASPKEAFELLSDVPKSGSHVPNVEKIVPLGDAFHWKIGAVKTKGYSAYLEYACKYRSDKEQLTVQWTPVSGIGNGKVSGKWSIRETSSGGSEITLDSRLAISLDIPRLLRKPVEHFVAKQNNHHTDLYIENLKRTLRG